MVWTATILGRDICLSEFDDILLGHGDWFDAQLIRLIAKADSVNRERLRKGYPAEVREVERRLNLDREPPVGKPLVEVFKEDCHEGEAHW